MSLALLLALALLAAPVRGAEPLAAPEPAAAQAPLPAVGAFRSPTQARLSRMAAAVAGTCALGWGLATWARRRRVRRGGQTRIQVLAARSLGARHQVVLIEVGGRRLLVGTASDHIATLADLSEPAFSEELERRLEPDSPRLVDEIGPSRGSMLRAVRDLPAILEALGDYGDKTKDTELLTELVRERLAAQISADLAPDGKLGVLVLSPEIEQRIKGSLQRTDHGTLITLDPVGVARIVGAVRSAVERVSVLHPDPPTLTSPEVRPHLRRMTERFLPRSAVISANELAPEIQVESIGQIETDTGQG